MAWDWQCGISNALLPQSYSLPSLIQQRWKVSLAYFVFLSLADSVVPGPGAPIKLLPGRGMHKTISVSDWVQWETISFYIMFLSNYGIESCPCAFCTDFDTYVHTTTCMMVPVSDGNFCSAMDEATSTNGCHPRVQLCFSLEVLRGGSEGMQISLDTIVEHNVVSHCIW